MKNYAQNTSKRIGAKTYRMNFLNELLEMFKELHALPEIYDDEIDLKLMKDEIKNIENPKKLNPRRGLTTFSLSSANKCKCELYYRPIRAEARRKKEESK